MMSLMQLQQDFVCLRTIEELDLFPQTNPLAYFFIFDIK
jgi:hypothetical protein